MKIKKWLIFIGFLFIFFMVDFSNPNEVFADIYRNSSVKSVGEEMRFCLPKKDNQYQDAKTNLSSISIFGSLNEGEAIGIYLGFVTAQSAISLAILLATSVGNVALMITAAIIVASITIVHTLVATLSVYGIYIAKIATDVFTNLIKIISDLFSKDSKKDSVSADFITMLQEILGLFTPLTGTNVYTSSTLSNMTKDLVLGTNYYCYNIAGFSQSESSPHKLSPYLFKELNIMENKYMQYPIYPKKSLIIKGQCSP